MIRLPAALRRVSILVAVLPFWASGIAMADAGRKVAVTFDDLPIVSQSPFSDAALEDLTARLVSAISAREIPAVGFVNEMRLYDDSVLNPDRVALLGQWLEAGLALGNHTYSHPDLHRVTLQAFQADVLRGEAVTRPLLGKYGRQLTWFRHPFLHTGTKLETKHAFESFLTEHGYRVAPVTIDNSEWIFARAFDIAMREGDRALAVRIGEDYVAYMLRMFAFYEAQAEAILGRRIPHVLLLHANQLNAHWFGPLADRLAVRQYSFVSLEAALDDPAYDSADAYTGPGGITWLHRWAITAGVDRRVFRGEPETPPYILELTGLREHYYPSESE